MSPAPRSRWCPVQRWAIRASHRDQARGKLKFQSEVTEIAALAILTPDNQCRPELNLGSPQTIIKIFVQQSGCFTLAKRHAR